MPTLSNRHFTTQITNKNTPTSKMAKLPLLSLSLSLSLLCLLFLFPAGSLAITVSRSARYRTEEYYRRQSICQFDRLQALEPDTRIEAEAGVTESWNPSRDQFQCAGVAVVRRTIEPNGLHLPSYTSAPQIVYIVRGRGIVGTVFPGCAETFEEPQRGQSQSTAGGGAPEDRHQKLRHIREGDVLALPAGVAYWSYNNANEPLVCISLLDTSNIHNQLDQFPRRFYLAGNPEEEFRPQQQEQQHQYLGPRDPSQYGLRSEKKKNNIFRGFNSRYLEEAFNVDSETVRRLQGQDDNRNDIIRVKGGKLELVSPVMRSSQEHQREQHYQEEIREREQGRWNDNGLEETFCSMRLNENIGDPSRSDVFNPQAGRISTANSFNLPILRFLRLSAEKGNLYKNGIYTPHWNQNAHSVMYVIRGRARVQVVDHFGQSFFDGEVREGQVLVVPQQHAVVKQASSSEGFEWVSFKTNDNAWISPIAGRTSVIRALPEAVLMNAFQISRDQAKRLKYNREETFLFSSSTPSQPRAVA